MILSAIDDGCNRTKPFLVLTLRYFYLAFANWYFWKNQVGELEDHNIFVFHMLVSEIAAVQLSQVMHVLTSPLLEAALVIA